MSIREPILENGARLNDLLGVISSTSSPFNFLADLLDSESEIVKESAYNARNYISLSVLIFTVQNFTNKDDSSRAGKSI